MTLFTLLFVAVVATPGPTPAVPGEPILHTFTNRDLEIHAKPQVWSMVQDRAGIVYAAANEALVEYDGVSWRALFLPGEQTIRSLAMDDDGTIWVGAHGEIGRAWRDPNGVLRYESLTAYLPEKDRSFGDVWQTFATPDGVWFVSPGHIFHWHDDEFTVVTPDPPENAFHVAFMAGSRLLVRQRHVGMVELGPDGLRLLPGGADYAEEGVMWMDPLGDGRLLFGTWRLGLLVFDGQRFAPWATNADDQLRVSQVYHGAVRSDGSVVVGTRKAGALVFDARGELQRVVDHSSGLPSDTIRFVLEDSQGGTWLGLEQGFAWTDLRPIWSIFDEADGVPVSVVTVAEHGGAIYAGGNQGLFRIEGRGIEAGWSETGSVWELLEANGDLLAATQTGVLVVEGDHLVTVHDSAQTYQLAPFPGDPDRLLSGHRHGLSVLVHDEQGWRHEGDVEGLSEEVRHVAVGRDVWISPTRGGLARVRLEGLRATQIDRFGPDQGMPPGLVRLHVIEGRVVFRNLVEDATYAFDPVAGRFAPDRDFGHRFGLEADRVVPTSNSDEDGRFVVSMATGTRDGWRTVLVEPDGEGGFTTFVVEDEPVDRQCFRVRFWRDDRLWLGGDDGLVRCDLGELRRDDVTRGRFATVVRRVEVRADQLLPVAGGFVLDHQDNQVRVEVAAPYFGAEARTEYQFLLEGLDREWSAWTEDAHVAYSGLREGGYRLRARARDLANRTSAEAVLPFRVLAPWYRTWWAYGAYLALLLAFIWPLHTLLARRMLARRTRSILDGMLADIRTLGTIEEVAESVANHVLLAFQLKRVALLCRGGGTGMVVRTAGGLGSELELPSRSQLLRFVDELSGSGSYDQLRSQLTDQDRSWLDTLEPSSFLTLNGSAGRPLGLVILGTTVTQSRLSVVDLRLLTQIAAPIGIVLENLVLHARVERGDRERDEVLARLAGDEVQPLKECPECGRCYDGDGSTCPDDGSELEVSMPVERLVAGRYRLERRLGAGGMGAVYEATDRLLRRRVAVKILVGSAFQTRVAMVRFEREARSAGGLKHPNIAAVHDFGRIRSESAFLVMELVEGPTLRRAMREAGQVAPAVAASWLDQLLDAIGAAHDHGIIHRDIKPENALLGRDARGRALIKLVDFGLARVKGIDSATLDTLTAPGTVMGTLAYMSPEQLQGDPVDERTDLFAIGVIAYECVVGERPFSGKTPLELITSILTTPVRLEGTGSRHAALELVLGRALAKDPKDRFRSAAQLQEALIPVLRSCPELPPRETAGSDRETRVDRKPQR